MNQPTESNEPYEDNSVELRLAKLLRRADESDISVSQQFMAFDPKLTPHELSQLESAGECLKALDQFRIANHADETAPKDATINQNQPHCKPLIPRGRFGRYTIEHQIGEGGFSRVYMAYDASLDRKLALKIPKSDVAASPEARARFQREAKAAAALSHPAIIPVFDSGDVDGVFYIGFALCEGASLAEYLKGDSLSTDTIAAVVARIAEAIEHAHRNGVIHRDLKPANILVDNANQELPIADRIRITDFGLALQQTEEQQKLTMTGTLVGTPVYMSPEQIKNGNAVGKSTDIYSLGVILYELLVGQAPHKKDNYASTLHAVATQPVTSLRHSNNAVSKDLEAICLKCLAQDPCDRYASAFDLASDLNRYIDRQPIIARRIGAVGQLKRWALRNPLLATGITTTVLVLVAGIITIASMWKSAETNRIAAEELRTKESQAKEVAQQRSEDLAKQVEILKSIFKNLNPFHEEIDDASLRQRLADRLVDSANLIVESSDDPTQQISLLGVLSNSLSSLGDADVAFEVAEMAVDISTSERATAGDRLRSQVAKAYALNAQSDHVSSKNLLAEIKQSVIDSDEFEYDEKAMLLMMLAHQWFANAYDVDTNAGYNEASELFEELLSFTASDPAANAQITASRLVAQFRLAEISHLQGTNMIAVMKSVIDDAEADLGPTHATTISFLNHLGQSQTSSKDYAGSKQTAEDSYKRSREKFGPYSGRTLESLDVLIIACGRSAQKPESRKRLKEVLPIAQQICESFIRKQGLTNRKLFTRYGNVATGWSLIGELDKCIEIKQNIVDAATEKLGRNNSTTQVQLMGLGYALRAAGRLDEAKDVLDEFLEFVDSNSDRDNPIWKKRARTTKKELLFIETLRFFGANSEKRPGL